MSFDPLDPDQLKKVLRRVKKTRDFKKFGQNFLVDKKSRDQIVTAAALTKKDQVLEIGPGAGALTGELVKKAGRVIAVDIDPVMVKITKLAVGTPANLELRLQDVRQINLPKLFCTQGESKSPGLDGNYVVVSNLPFLLTGFIIKMLLTSSCSPKKIIVMVQKEVAQRIMAGPGQHSLLSLSVQVFGKPRLVMQVSRELFWPAPEVDAGVIAIERRPLPLVPPAEQEIFFKTAVAGFSSKRKKLINTLSGSLGVEKDLIKKALRQAKIPFGARAQELSVKNWAFLSQKIKKFL